MGEVNLYAFQLFVHICINTHTHTHTGMSEWGRWMNTFGSEQSMQRDLLFDTNLPICRPIASLSFSLSLSPSSTCGETILVTDTENAIEYYIWMGMSVTSRHATSNNHHQSSCESSSWWWCLSLCMMMMMMMNSKVHWDDLLVVVRFCPYEKFSN